MQSSTIISLALVLISVGLYFWLIDPTYARIQELTVRDADLSEAVDSAKSFFNTLEDKRARYRAAIEDPERGGRLLELLPDTIDSTRLILTVEDVGLANNVSIAEVEVDNGEDTFSSPTPDAPGAAGIGATRLTLTAEGTYDDLFAFLQDLERSIRLIEVEQLTITPPDEGAFAISAEPNYEFTMTIATFWFRTS